VSLQELSASVPCLADSISRRAADADIVAAKGDSKLRAAFITTAAEYR